MLQYLNCKSEWDVSDCMTTQLDTFVLRFCSFFAYSFYAFTIIPSVLELRKGEEGEESTVVSLLTSTGGWINAAEVTLQIAFLLELKRKV